MAAEGGALEGEQATLAQECSGNGRPAGRTGISMLKQQLCSTRLQFILCPAPDSQWQASS